ncbi:rod-binding protein [Shewanella polaris]|uniref:Peptidoglycan hydrolase n=1 Tax=Shewanella polaris TaxID=2588449 RepID=A0A4Y5YC93_9GAMM|nr:rod-binding protein [Shewanella polaris]QDE30294.1 peptidoglycan hydrolase [Shewanella polaris]
MKLENGGGYLSQQSAGELIKTNGEHGALKVVSQQFEAQFLQTVLKQMRSASDVMADEDSPFSSKNDGLYRDLHDAELAMHLSKLQNMGLSDVMTKQLSSALKSAPQSVALESNNKQDNDIQVMNTTAMQPALIMPKLAKDTK